MPTPITESGCESEFTAFMRAYQDMVFSTAARLSGEDAQAEDIAQEVFVKAYEHFDELRASPAAGGWLKTVTTHLTLNYLTRYRKRRRLFSELSSTEGASSEGVEGVPLADVTLGDPVLAQLGAAEQSRAIEEALRRLPSHQRVPLVLYHFEEMSYEQIASRLRVSLAKVKTDIRRARLALLPALKASGFA